MDVENNQKLVDFYAKKENIYKICSELYPNKKKSYKDLSKKVKISYDSTITTITRNKEWFNYEIVDGIKLICLTPETTKKLETEFQTYQNQQKQAETYYKEQQEEKNKEENIIQKFKDYIDDTESIQVQLELNNNLVELDFMHMAQHDLEISEYFLDNTIKSLEMLEHFLLNKKVFPINLPKSCYTPLCDVRNNHINKLIQTKAQIKGKTKIKALPEICVFECPSCGHLIKVKQLGTKIKIPNRCGCGRKGKFIHLEDKDIISDYQLIKIESVKDDDDNIMPTKFDLIMKGDLISKNKETNLKLGSRVNFNGIIKITSEIETDLLKDFYMEAVSFKTLDEDARELTPTPEELIEIKKIIAGEL